MNHWRSKRVLLLAAIVVLAASACRSITPNEFERACAQSRGQWRTGCGLKIYQCFMPYRDSGKVCDDSSQCEGRCLFDLVIHCDGPGKCTYPDPPDEGERALGRCEYEDDTCGSTIEIKEGIAQRVRLHD